MTHREMAAMLGTRGLSDPPGLHSMQFNVLVDILNESNMTPLPMTNLLLVNPSIP